MINQLWVKLKEAMMSVLPIALIVVILNFTPLISLTTRELLIFVISAIVLIIGIGLFNLGADLAMTPMGEQVGAGLTKLRNMKVLLLCALILGFLVTVAEPDLSVLASQVEEVINGTTLIIFIGVGVGIFLVIAVLKMIFKKSLSHLLTFFYCILFAITALVAVNGGKGFLPLAFDSGGVTTGPITVPFIMALGVGIASAIGGRNSQENSFGLISLCSVGPIIAVLILGVISGGDIPFALADYSIPKDLGLGIAKTLLTTLKDVALALGLIVVFFFVINAIILHIPRKKISQVIVGIAYTFVGLIIFLTAVSVGFMPIGYRLGEELASSGSTALIVAGFVLGLVVVLAEPAVHVLNKQVEDITNGSISKSSMMIALSLGVGISICLSMIRIVFDFSILYYLIPGYFMSLGLAFFVPNLYTAVAFDSGGVASGPLTSSFILPFAIGACVVMQGEASVMADAFGIVAMVALTPLITIQLLGFRAVAHKLVREKIAMRKVLEKDDEQIIYFD